MTIDITKGEYNLLISLLYCKSWNCEERLLLQEFNDRSEHLINTLRDCEDLIKKLDENMKNS